MHIHLVLSYDFQQVSFYITVVVSYLLPINKGIVRLIEREIEREAKVQRERQAQREARAAKEVNIYIFCFLRNSLFILC